MSLLSRAWNDFVGDKWGYLRTTRYGDLTEFRNVATAIVDLDKRLVAIEAAKNIVPQNVPFPDREIVLPAEALPTQVLNIAKSKFSKVTGAVKGKINKLSEEIRAEKAERKAEETQVPLD